MGGDIYFIKDLRDLTFSVDQEGLAISAHILFPVHALFTPYAVIIYDLLIGVGEQVKRKLIFRDKFLVRFLAIGRNTQHADAL